MSYIRYGQDGTYIDIPGGSMYYIYGDREMINGWTEQEFAALVGEIVYQMDVSDRTKFEVGQAFRKHFGGWNKSYDGGVAAPERAEIFCQCVDSRMSDVELTDELHEAAREWTEANDESTTECDFCGDMYRSKLSLQTSACDKDECSYKQQATTWNELDWRDIRRGARLGDILMGEYDYSPKESSSEEVDYLYELEDRRS